MAKRQSARLRRLTAQVVRRARLWTAVLATVAGAIVVAISAYLGLHQLLPSGNDPIQPKDLTQFALTIVAGIGGVVALVVAYRRQQGIEQSRFVERFGAAASQLGHSDVAVRLAGVYAMAGVADEAFASARQQCVDVLCGYLRLPYSPALGANHLSELQHNVPGREGEGVTHRFLYRQNDKEVRQTIVRVIAAHLQEDAAESWSGCTFDFQGAALEAADFSGAIFNGRRTSFIDAVFSGERTHFSGAAFGGGRTLFHRATFGGEQTSFGGAVFAAGKTYFSGATFSSERVWFGGARFSGGPTYFSGAIFTGERTAFRGATFSGGPIYFSGATFNAERTWFDGATFTGESTWFDRATFSGARTLFSAARFNAERTWFVGASFQGESIWFDRATFGGGHTSFDRATFAGGRTSFEETTFSGKRTSFDRATLSGDRISFARARFIAERCSFDETTFSGKQTSFRSSEFTAGTVSFRGPKKWNPAPQFDWDDDMPPAQRMPKPENVVPPTWPPKVRT